MAANSPFPERRLVLKRCLDYSIKERPAYQDAVFPDERRLDYSIKGHPAYRQDAVFFDDAKLLTLFNSLDTVPFIICPSSFVNKNDGYYRLHYIENYILQNQLFQIRNNKLIISNVRGDEEFHSINALLRSRGFKDWGTEVLNLGYTRLRVNEIKEHLNYTVQRFSAPSEALEFLPNIGSFLLYTLEEENTGQKPLYRIIFNEFGKTPEVSFWVSHNGFEVSSDGKDGDGEKLPTFRDIGDLIRHFIEPVLERASAYGIPVEAVALADPAHPPAVVFSSAAAGKAVASEKPISNVKPAVAEAKSAKRLQFEHCLAGITKAFQEDLMLVSQYLDALVKEKKWSEERNNKYRCPVHLTVLEVPVLVKKQYPCADLRNILAILDNAAKKGIPAIALSGAAFTEEDVELDLSMRSMIEDLIIDAKAWKALEAAPAACFSV